MSNNPPKDCFFLVITSIQNRNLWALADTGSCRNLMSENFWKALPIPVTLTPPGTNVVVAGDRKILDHLGSTILNFEIAG